MSIIVSDVSYHYPNQHPLFGRLSFAVEDHDKVAVVGNNGTGKSTLLKLIAGHLKPEEGNITSSSSPYYIRQHTGILNQTIVQALSVDKKIEALRAIENGSVMQSDYDTLDDDWDIESRCMSALSYWQLPEVSLNASMDSLSGGEKTKVFLSGLIIHTPDIILLDEPTNHLDRTSRELLYRFIRQSKATIIIVSHDITLLDLLHTTYELSGRGIRLYGGNYSFYREQKELEVNALGESIREEEKMLRLARKKAQEVRERQEKRASQGAKKGAQGGGARILLNALGNAAENTAAKLKDKHTEIIVNSKDKLSELRQQQERQKELKMDFDNTSLHAGKLLFEAEGVNIAFQPDVPLWKTPLDFKLYSDDRIHILGDNGVGKTSFIRLLTGELAPSCGQINRTDFNWIYLDQEYAQVDVDCSVVELAERHNLQQLEEHEVKLRLNRFLFPSDTWGKNCKQLSGGEKMRLYLCCLMISNQTPDLIILDEPTNNLDISSLQILTQTIKDYRGSLLVISHDNYFIDEIGVTAEITLSRL